MVLFSKRSSTPWLPVSRHLSKDSSNPNTLPENQHGTRIIFQSKLKNNQSHPPKNTRDMIWFDLIWYDMIWLIWSYNIFYIYIYNCCCFILSSTQRINHVAKAVQFASKELKRDPEVFLKVPICFYFYLFFSGWLDDSKGNFGYPWEGILAVVPKTWNTILPHKTII